MKRKVKKTGKVSVAVKKYVQKKIEHNIEHKQTYLSFPGNAISVLSGTRYLINAPDTASGSLIEGTDWFDHIGSEYLIKSVTARGVVRIANLALSHFETVRAILMMEKQPEGVAFAGAELLLDVASGRGIMSDFNAKHKHRFVILRDQVFDLNDFTGLAAGAGVKKFIKMSYTFKKPVRTVLYNDPAKTNTGVAAVEKTAIYLVLLCGANCLAEAIDTSCIYLDA